MSETSQTDYRRIEKLIALLRDEFARGSGAIEHAEEMFDFARNLTIEPPRASGIDPDADLTMPELDAIVDDCTFMGEALARALIMMGFIDRLEAFIEHMALRRAQCEAKFKSRPMRAIPFTEDEQKALSHGWDEHHAKWLASQSQSEVAS